MAVGSANVALAKPIRSPSEDGVITVKKGAARVKIYPVLNCGKRLFMVTWLVAGRRHRRNFADEAEARKEATLVATKLSAGEAQVLMLTSGDRESYLEAKRLLAPLGVPLHDAIKDYVAARTLLQEDALLPAARYSRACHVLRPERARRAADVLAWLERATKAHGAPAFLRRDNGPENYLSKPIRPADVKVVLERTIARLEAGRDTETKRAMEDMIEVGGHFG